MRMRVFVGSSSEAISYAHAVQELLSGDATPIVWDQDVFRLSKTTLDSLAEISGRVDAAVFIFAPDDKLDFRGKVLATARDNVVYELGLFSGRLEPQRCFVIAPTSTMLRIPSDLLGYTRAAYDPTERNPVVALGTACNQIRRALGELGRFSSEESALGRDTDSPTSAIDGRDLGGLWLSRFEFKSHRSRTYSAGLQYSLEELVPQGKRTLMGANLLARASNGKGYLHQLRLTTMRSHLVGRWFNVNHESVGACQLRVHSNRNILEGLHLGDADDESVQTGRWVWLRLAPDRPRGTAGDKPLSKRKLKATGTLNALFRTHLKEDVPIPLSKILER